MKRLFLLFFTVACVLSLSACAPELYERLLISAIGVDRTETGLRRVTVLAAPEEEGRDELCLSGEGESVPAAMEQIALRTGKAPLYSHNALLVLGRACAEEGIREDLDFFIRHYESRPTVDVFLAQNTSEEILTPEEGEARVPAERISELAKSAERTGLSVSATVLSIVHGTDGEGFGAALPVIEKEDGAVRIRGTALLDDWKLRCVLTEEETRGLLALCGKLQAGETVVEDESGKTTVNLRQTIPEIHFIGTTDDLRFSVSLEVTGEISAADRPDVRAAAFARTEKLLSERVLQHISLYLEKALYQNGADAAGFGSVIFREAPKVWEAVSADWPEPLRNAAFQIEVQSVIDRVEEEELFLLD